MSATILAVDDDESNLQLLRDVCEASGWVVATEKEGASGLSRAREVKPDVILLDIMMPGTGGMELLESLQADPDLKQVPVVFVTAVNDPRSEEKAFQLGAVDYVRKPFRVFDLQARIRTALEVASYRPGHGKLATGPDVLGKEIEALLARARGGERFGCAVVSMDGFAELRKRDAGRAAAVLAALARKLRRNIRGRDALFLGTEAEFVLFFPSSDRDGVTTAVERLSTNVKSVPVEGESMNIALRFGYLTVPHAMVRTAMDLLSVARNAAEEARKAGKHVYELKQSQ
jgi:CheY-like chemotaxis protein/GGDEF domain-containing protein